MCPSFILNLSQNILSRKRSSTLTLIETLSQTKLCICFLSFFLSFFLSLFLSYHLLQNKVFLIFAFWEIRHIDIKNFDSHKLLWRNERTPCNRLQLFGKNDLKQFYMRQSQIGRTHFFLKLIKNQYIYSGLRLIGSLRSRP